MGRLSNSYVQPYSCYELGCVLVSSPEVGFILQCSYELLVMKMHNLTVFLPLQSVGKGKLLMIQAKVQQFYMFLAFPCVDVACLLRFKHL